MTAQHETMRELFKMFLNLDGFEKCSSVSRIPRIPALGNSVQTDHESNQAPHRSWLIPELDIISGFLPIIIHVLWSQPNSS